MTEARPPIFRSAISDDSGGVDAGYLAMVWGLIVWSTCSIATVITGATSVIARTEDAAAIIQATGIALGAEAGAFAAMLGAVGLFRMGDKPRAASAPAQPPSPVNIQMQPNAPTPAPSGGPEAIAILQPPAKLADAPKRKR